MLTPHIFTTIDSKKIFQVLFVSLWMMPLTVYGQTGVGSTTEDMDLTSGMGPTLPWSGDVNAGFGNLVILVTGGVVVIAGLSFLWQRRSSSRNRNLVRTAFFNRIRADYLHYETRGATTTLEAVAYLADALQTGVREGLPRSARDGLTEMARETRRHVSNFRELDKLSQQDRTIKTGLYQTVANALERCRDLVDSRGVTLENRVSENAARFAPDARLLGYIVSLLVCKASERVRTGSIAVSASNNDRETVVCITDSATLENTDRLQRFFENPDPESGIDEDHALVRHMTARMGGTLAVKLLEDGQTEFSLTIGDDVFTEEAPTVDLTRIVSPSQTEIDGASAINEELRILDEAASAINREIALVPLAETLVHHVLRLYPRGRSAVFLHGPDETEPFTCTVVVGMNRGNLENRRFPREQVLRVLVDPDHALGQGIYSGSRAVSEMFPGEAGPVSSIVTRHTHVTGMIVIWCTDDGTEPSVLEVEKLARFREFLAIAVDRARLLALEKQRQNDLVQAQEILVMQEKMATLGILTAGVAHEINNPTNFTDMSAQLLTGEMEEYLAFLIDLAGDDADPEVVGAIRRRHDRLASHLETIREGTRRIMQISRDLGVFSRRNEDLRDDVKIGDCLRSTVSLVRTKYREAAIIECAFRVDPEIPCRPAQLNQVFMNLIVNACQAIAAHRREQGLEGPGRLQITTDLEDGDLVIRFTDNGGGIPDKVRDRIFEPFFTTKPEGHGTGLGLSISNRIVEEHGGRIRVDTIAGTGTTFIIKLPLTAAAREEV